MVMCVSNCPIINNYAEIRLGLNAFSPSASAPNFPNVHPETNSADGLNVSYDDKKWDQMHSEDH